jgi:hypothetical protein
MEQARPAAWAWAEEEVARDLAVACVGGLARPRAEDRDEVGPGDEDAEQVRAALVTFGTQVQ